MKLVMTLLVRDEEDILRENLEFHLARGVDFIIAMDNLSVDATTEILREYESRGVLHYIYEGDDDYNQHAWVTRMAHMACSEFQADWVINNDADEFWWPLQGSLNEIFAQLPPGTDALQAQRYNFVLSNDNSGPFWSNMTFRQRVPVNSMGNPLPPKVAHRGSRDVQVHQGSHRVSGLPGSLVCTDAIEVLHFPVRGAAQIVAKITKGGAAYERNTELDERVGRTWRELHKVLQADGHLDAYFQSQYYDAIRLAEAVSAGDLVEDRRLHDFFKGH